MRLRCVTCSLLAVGLFSWLPATHAVDTTVLRDAPIEIMTPQDLDLLQESAYRALDETQDGGELRWANPLTDAHGTIKPTATWREHGLICRTLQFDHQVKARSGHPKFEFCKQPAGRWEIVPH